MSLGVATDTLAQRATLAASVHMWGRSNGNRSCSAACYTNRSPCGPLRFCLQRAEPACSAVPHEWRPPWLAAPGVKNENPGGACVSFPCSFACGCIFGRTHAGCVVRPCAGRCARARREGLRPRRNPAVQACPRSGRYGHAEMLQEQSRQARSPLPRLSEESRPVKMRR